MHNTILAFLGLVAWPIVLLTVIAILRTYLSATGKRAANSFAPTGEDVSEFSQRLVRAHANCYEFVPFALALLLFALVTEQTAITDPLAMILLFARVAQSVIHLASTSTMAVSLRFLMFAPQIVIAFYWLFQFFGAVR